MLLFDITFLKILNVFDFLRPEINFIAYEEHTFGWLLGFLSSRVLPSFDMVILIFFNLGFFFPSWGSR